MTTRIGWRVWLALTALLVLGVYLRLDSLGRSALFIDEAESCINALTILERGYPADSYLGQPMFENTLTEFTPRDAEYEFRDSSYSSRGMATYHGWLPLYAIAASLALHGIRPDVPVDPPRVQHDDAEIHRRISAARLPSVFFGALFLLAIFLSGRALYGADAGMAAVLAATLAPKCIWLAQQARYYSAALALSTLAVACAWRVRSHGRPGDFVAAGIVFVLLFHTSSLAFAIVLLPCVVLLPGILRHEDAIAKLITFALVVGVGLVPWMQWAGYLENPARIPMARSFLDFPHGYLVYLGARPTRVIAGAGCLLAFGALWVMRRRLPWRVVGPLESAGMPALFLTAWILSAYFGFLLLVPAASCSMARLSHALVAGPILLGSVGLAWLARVFFPERSILASAGGALAVLLALCNVARRQESNPYESEAVFQLVDHLREQELANDTRIYALPYQHFCLTYYTGLPVQSIAPVRREFLDRYPGEVLILETATRFPPPNAQQVRSLTRKAGIELDQAELTSWIPRLHARMVRAEVEPLVSEVLPDEAPAPEWVAPLVADLLAEAAERRSGVDYSLDNPAMFRGHAPMTMAEFWPAFFYRFVGPEERSGARLNYARRAREASALVLPSTWVVLRCPARPEQDTGAAERGAHTGAAERGARDAVQ